MPVFELEANGKRFQVEAPDIQSAVRALTGNAPAQPQQPSQPDQSAAPDPQGTMGTPDAQAALMQAADAKRQQMGLAGPKGDRIAAPAPAGPNYAEAPAQPAQDPLGGFMHLLGIPGGQQAAAAARGAADSATFGFGDEGAAALAVKPFEGNWGGQYDANLARVRAEQEAAQKAHPIEFAGGQVGGAVATAALTPELTPLRALGVGGRIAEGAAVGGAYGGAYGAGSANGSIGDRASGAASGTLLGLAGGAAGTAALEGATGLARGAYNAVAPTIRGLINPETEAARRVAGAQARDARIPQDRITPQDEQTAGANGQPVYNIDRGGETTRALGRSAANTSPEGRAALTTATGDRFDAQGQRTVDTVRRIVGNNTTVDAREQLLADAAAANRPAYERAYRDPAAQGVWDQGLEQLSGAPVVQDAIRQATVTGRNSGALNGLPPVRNPFTIDRATGRVTLAAADAQGNQVLPNLQFWDHVKRNLDAVGTPEARQAARVLRDHLDQLVPAYGQARSGAARAFGARDALEAGDQFVMSRMANDEARRALGQMSPPERELFAQGFADSLVRRIQETGDRRSVVNSIFGSQAARDRVNIALGPQRAAQMEAFLRVETLLDRARTAVTGNSTTARQLTELGLAGGVGLAASGGNPLDPKAWLTAALVRGGRAGLRGIDVRVAQRVATMLASEDPALVQRGVQIVAKNNRLFDALRSADVPAAAIGSETAVRSWNPRRQPALAAR